MEKAAVARIAGSLQVPSVQELAAKANGSGEVPARYLYPEIEPAQVVSDNDDVGIPVIDMGRLLDPQFSQDEVAKLGRACQEWGFFQLKNHGIANDVIEKMKNDAIDFFNISLEEKIAIAQTKDSIEGYCNRMVYSNNETYDWADMLYLITSPEDIRRMKVWPSKPNSFKDSLSNYSLEVKKLVVYLLEAITKSLGIAPEVLLSKFANQQQNIKLTYYPPCQKHDKVLGIRKHSDACAITLLLEVNGVQGLQIKMKDKWIAVKSLPDAFIINVGDTIEMLTNGKYKSIEHRVTVNNKKERITISAFHQPNEDAIIGPLPDILENDIEKYKTMTFGDFMKTFFSARQEGKNFVEKIKLSS